MLEGRMYRRCWRGWSGGSKDVGGNGGIAYVGG